MKLIHCVWGHQKRKFTMIFRIRLEDDRSSKSRANWGRGCVPGKNIDLWEVKCLDGEVPIKVENKVRKEDLVRAMCTMKSCLCKWWYSNGFNNQRKVWQNSNNKMNPRTWTVLVFWVGRDRGGKKRENKRDARDMLEIITRRRKRRRRRSGWGIALCEVHYTAHSWLYAKLI